MYALVNNQTVEKFPYTIGDLRKDNPQTSFPQNIPQDTLREFGVVPVVDTPVVFDEKTQVVERTGCAFSPATQQWEVTWNVRSKTAEELERVAKDVREERNQKLKETDWTQVADSPVDKTAWAAYRQSLRDITAQPGFPTSVTWPVAP